MHSEIDFCTFGLVFVDAIKEIISFHNSRPLHEGDALRILRSSQVHVRSQFGRSLITQSLVVIINHNSLSGVDRECPSRNYEAVMIYFLQKKIKKKKKMKERKKIINKNVKNKNYMLGTVLGLCK